MSRGDTGGTNIMKSALNAGDNKQYYFRVRLENDNLKKSNELMKSFPLIFNPMLSEDEKKDKKKGGADGGEGDGADAPKKTQKAYEKPKTGDKITDVASDSSAESLARAGDLTEKQRSQNTFKAFEDSMDSMLMKFVGSEHGNAFGQMYAKEKLKVALENSRGCLFIVGPGLLDFLDAQTSKLQSTIMNYGERSAREISQDIIETKLHTMRKKLVEFNSYLEKEMASKKAVDKVQKKALEFINHFPKSLHETKEAYTQYFTMKMKEEADKIDLSSKHRRAYGGRRHKQSRKRTLRTKKRRR
jgi:hypothetical protein